MAEPAKVLRAGIVGMGIGKDNGRAIAANPRGRVTAICDIVPEKMPPFAKELPNPVRQYADYREMCRDPEVGAVFVGTPNQLHVPVALEAVRNGKHVLVTKPLSDGVGSGEELVREAEASGLVNMMSLNTRFAPQCRHVTALKEKGYFGEIYYAKARSVRRSGIPDWNLGFITEGGGAFRDMGVHVLDAAWSLLGFPKPLSVSGVGGAKFGNRGQGYAGFRTPPEDFSRRFEVDDYAGGFVRFEGGAGMQVESFWASHQPEEFQVEVFGTEAGARLYPPTLYRTEGGVPHDTVITPQQKNPGWDNLAGHFIDCVLDGVPCQAPLRHGLVVQRMMEAMLESARTGREVRLD